MSFSMETEKENKLSFLDVEVIRKQGKFTTTIYRKPTFSGVYSNFENFTLLVKFTFMMKDHNYLIFQPVFNYFQVFSGTTDKICNSCNVKQQFYSRTCLYSYLQNSIMIHRKLFKTRQIMFYS